MFKLAVFSIILFVLSVSATAEEQLSTGVTDNGQPCHSVHYFVNGSYHPYVNRIEYLSKHAAFVARQRKRGYAPLQKNDTYDCHYNVDTEKYQFDSYRRTEHLNGIFNVTTWFSYREFSWTECLFEEQTIDCVPLNAEMYLCTLRVGCRRSMAFVFVILILLLIIAALLAIMCYLDTREKRQQALQAEVNNQEHQIIIRIG